MPAPVRQNIANLGLFVFKQTLAMLADPQPESLGSLIHINRELAAGCSAARERATRRKSKNGVVAAPRFFAVRRAEAAISDN